jgi:putative oxidoreductase
MSLLRPHLDRLDRVADHLQAPLLLAIRLFWGLGFAQAGWGKLMNLERTTAFFADLGLPAAGANAFAAGLVECAGGVLLALGFLSRPAATALAFTMAVAYATAERDALRGLFREPDAFTGAAPFLFLLASLLVLAFGPGAWSVDARLRRPAPAA